MSFSFPKQINSTKIYDAVIIGAGVSGSIFATNLHRRGANVLLLEAGEFYNKETYPKHEIDANSKLYWSGGIEFNQNFDIGFLRPKAVGGGSIVNQALLDRFDDQAFNSWRKDSHVGFFTSSDMTKWYEMAEENLAIQKIPKQFQNENAKIFQEGFDKNSYQCSPLTRAQKDCRYEEGYDCIDCLSGCRIDSKQSAPVSILNKAISDGLNLLPHYEVRFIKEKRGLVYIYGVYKKIEPIVFRTRNLILASGAIGNSKTLINSGFSKVNPNIGKFFYTHPQYMVLGLYDRAINAHKGPFQSLKSDEPKFRREGFKLENVFAPPVGLSMLLPGIGHHHAKLMKDISKMACIEVCIRDSNPGEIKVNSKGKVIIKKELGVEDKLRKKNGLKAISKIFESTGAKKIIEGDLGIGLHLMGGCRMGADATNSVVDPHFNVHGKQNIYLADSSIFPNAPGINPSLTIMALSHKASLQIM